MMRSTFASYFILVASYLFVVLFVYAAVRKVLDFETFRIQIGDTAMFRAYATGIAWSLIFFQLLTAALLLFRCARRIGLYLAFILMSLLTLYILFVLNFSQSIPCACSGIIPGMGWHAHLFLNTALTLIAFMGILLEKKHAAAAIQKTT